MAIPLDRKFINVHSDEKIDFSLDDVFFARHGSDGWDGLLQHQRVVILAEAGSGKTTELKSQADALNQKGEIAFYVPLHKVAKDGLPKGLSPKDRATFETWLHSDAVATFFFDSVDETKDASIRFSDALEQITDGIKGGEGRCKIFLSGRYTDWDFRHDFSAFEENLPIPVLSQEPEPLSGDEALRQVLYQEKVEEKPETAKAHVVVMAGLDHPRIEQYFRAKGIRDTDKLLQSIDDYNLWDLARRPLDLDWLSNYWEAKGQLGKLNEMIELGLSERIREADPHRSRTDDLDKEKAILALERIGAALVLNKSREINLTDDTNDSETVGIALADIIPDWSPKDQTKLLSRAVFDPATFGRTRLTNDNNGVVRSFLTAKWLLKRLQADWPKKSLSKLLFSNVYGKAVVRPSLAQTAAWLALWDRDIANDIVRIDPQLLLSLGDPASLPLTVKEAALSEIVQSLQADSEIHGIGQDSLKRFSTPDLIPCVRKLWKQYHHITAARELLLRVIWLGRYTDCIDIVEEALGKFNDRYTRMFGGRAFITLGSSDQKKNFAKQVTQNCATLSNSLIWEAIELLLPEFLSVDQFLQIIRTIKLTDRDGGWGLDWHGENISKKIQSEEVCRELLDGLLKLYNKEVPTAGAESDFVPFLISCTHRLLELANEHSLPQEAIDSAILLRREKNAGRRYSRTTYKDLFQKTPERRRALLWGSVPKLRADKQFGEVPFDDPWSFDVYGLPLALQNEDVDWLLQDLAATTNPIDKKLVANCLLTIWRGSGRNEKLLEKLRDAAANENALAEAIEEWTKPREPSAHEVRHQQEMAKLDRKKKRQEAKRDASWKEFVDPIRENPSALETLVPPDKERGVDRRLYYLWKLITTSNRSRWAVKDVNILDAILGKEAAKAVQQAFITYWKQCEPIAHCDRAEDERNSVYAIDYIGILGITLQSQTGADWAEKLTEAEAVKAVAFATLELNGFPEWISDLAIAHPRAAQNELGRIIEAELAWQDSGQSGVLSDVARSPLDVQDLLEPMLQGLLVSEARISTKALGDVLSILKKTTSDRDNLLKLSLERFNKVSDLNAKALYLNAAFSIAPSPAAIALGDALSSLEFADQRALCTTVLPAMFGDRFRNESVDLPSIPAVVLEKLVRIAFQTIRVQEDHNRPSGEAYSPDERDNAEGARSILFKALIDRPGEYTYRSLLSLSEVPDFGVLPQRLRELAIERAQKDSETESWTALDVVHFEKELHQAAHTAKDMAELCLGHIETMGYQLLHSDFAQGSTLAIQPSEQAVQNWFCDRLTGAQSSYTVERESHVVDEKEPDVRIRSRTTDAAVPIEIKIAEDWTIAQLEAALKDQLCGQYLQDQNNRHGILLLVHRKTRPIGWTMPDGTTATFSGVTEHLKEIAKAIRASSEDARQPVISVLDVSSRYPKEKKVTTRAPSKPTKSMPTRKKSPASGK